MVSAPAHRSTSEQQPPSRGLGLIPPDKDCAVEARAQVVFDVQDLLPLYQISRLCIRAAGVSDLLLACRGSSAFTNGPVSVGCEPLAVLAQLCTPLGSRSSFDEQKVLKTGDALGEFRRRVERGRDMWAC